MALHLIKLSVGTDSIEDLEDWIAQKLKEQKKRGVKKPERVHTTRMVPKRTEEILDGGSIYWVIKGEVLCRERILDIRPFVDKDGIGRCRLVLDPKCVPVRPRPYRAFQGWRYLDPKDAPPDLDRLGRLEGVVVAPEIPALELAVTVAVAGHGDVQDIPGKRIARSAEGGAGQRVGSFRARNPFVAVDILVVMNVAQVDRLEGRVARRLRGAWMEGHR